MAMRQCKECGGQISTKAIACPACGAKMPPRTKIVTWVVGALALALMLKCSTDGIERDKTTAIAKAEAAASAASAFAAMSPTQRQAAERSGAAAAIVKANDRLSFDRAVSFATAVKDSAKNPASFEIASFSLMKSGALCLEYRARNGFNALVLESVVLPPLTGQPSAKPAAWNTHCAGRREGQDMGHVKYAM